MFLLCAEKSLQITLNLSLCLCFADIRNLNLLNYSQLNLNCNGSYADYFEPRPKADTLSSNGI